MISLIHSAICFNSSYNLLVTLVSLSLLEIWLAIWLCTRKLSYFNSKSLNKVKKELVKGIDDSIGIVLGIRAEGKAGSEIILGIVNWLNFCRNFWRKVHFLSVELLAAWSLDLFTGATDGLDVKAVGSLVTDDI